MPAVWLNSAGRFLAHDQLLASGSAGGIVQVWQLKDGQEALTLKATPGGKDGTITDVVFSPDGQQLVAGAQSLQNSVQFWRLATGELAGAYPGQYVPGNSSFANNLTFSPDGQYLAVATLDKGVWLIRVTDHALSTTLKVPNASGKFDEVVAAFSPDNQYVASATTSGALQIWRLADNKLLRTLRAHTQGITQLAFSPDGQYLATGSFDSTVRLWRVADIVK